ncbi:hypothetical protein AB0B66_10615 [Catellatospora sp. NPDC049111]|uniref:hypothetical protein n=1 Tax=Catellatospora sp. NPDC049111 TaxID=3155271 RepID=UPI0033DE83CB
MSDNFTFSNRQELATARAACRRMLAARLHLAPSQRDALTATLATLEGMGDAGSGSTLLNSSQQAALVSALSRLGRHAIGSTRDNAVEGLLARLPQVAPWPLPNLDVAQFVRLGFGDSHRLAVSSLSFAVAVPDLPTLETCLGESIRTYNNFDGRTIATALAVLWDDLSTVMLGRDSSPFVQMHIPYTRQQRNGGDNTHAIALEPAERDTVIDAVIAAGTACRADSILFTTARQPEPGPIRPAAADLATVRLWWD